MKKVLFAIPNLAGGGAEKVLVTILKNLDLSKYKITLFLIFYDGIYLKDVPDSVKVKYLFKTKHHLINRVIYKMFRYISPQVIYKWFVKEKYDVEIAFLEGIATKLVSGSSNPTSKKIAWVHTDLSSNHLTRHYFKDIEDELNCYKSFHKIIFVSNDAKEGYKKLFRYDKGLYVIYNPINENEVIEKAKEERISYKKFTVCSVGRLMPVKGYDRLIKVHARLRDEGLEHQLVIVGTGPLEFELKGLCVELDVNNTVTFEGFQTNPYKYLDAADLFVSSSLMEGFPLVLAESLMLEKPVISTRTSGPVEMLDNGKYGMLVENSEEGLYLGLKELIQNCQLREHYKQMARLRRSFFDLPSIIQKIENELDDVIN